MKLYKRLIGVGPNRFMAFYKYYYNKKFPNIKPYTRGYRMYCLDMKVYK